MLSVLPYFFISVAMSSLVTVLRRLPIHIVVLRTEERFVSHGERLQKYKIRF